MDFCPDQPGLYVFRSATQSNWHGQGGMVVALRIQKPHQRDGRDLLVAER